MVDIHLPKLLWVYCPGHAGVKGNDRANRLAGKATITRGLLLGRSEALKSLRLYLRSQSQGHNAICRLEERDVERGSARRSSFERTREGHRQSDEHWNHFKGNVGDTSERRGGAHMGFSERIDTILNCTELNCCAYLCLLSIPVDKARNTSSSVPFPCN